MVGDPWCPIHGQTLCMCTSEQRAQALYGCYNPCSELNNAFKVGYMISTEDNKIVDEVVAELDRAESKFDPFNSAHEGFAVLLEEVDELWDVVKLNPKKIQSPGFPDFESNESWQRQKHESMMREEAIQVAAMAMRFVKGIDSKWGKKLGKREKMK